MKKPTKYHILYSFVEGAFGGGNQFFKALREQWRKEGTYAEKTENVDVVILGTVYDYKKAHLMEYMRIKANNPEIIGILRIDGPFDKVRGKDFFIDKLNACIAKQLMDGVVYQSDWCKQENINLGFPKKQPNKIIINAPNSDIFYPEKSKKMDNNGKIKIIATSWSGDYNKGFDVYEWLDKNLDFNKYEFTFVGNSPIEFKNIIHIPPQNSYELAETIRNHHLFISASYLEACSNSLLEAMHSGLPAIARNKSSFPEIIGDKSLLFDTKEEIPEILDNIVKNYDSYRNSISLPSIEDIAKSYSDFAIEINNARPENKNNYLPKYKMLLARLCLLSLWSYQEIPGVKRRINKLKNIIMRTK